MIINLGDAPFKAFIEVTYPKGTCTVTEGSRSYSHSGGGTAVFTVNKKGTWTVTASYYSAERTASVKLSRSGEVQSVTISYNLDLFKNGVTAPEAGSWVGDKTLVHDGNYAHYGTAPTVSVGTNLVLNLGASAGVTGAVRSSKTIDLRPYSTLRCVIAANTSWNGAGAVVDNYIAVVPSGATRWAQSVARSCISGTATGTFDVNISSVNGYYNVAYLMESYGWRSNATISQIALLV